MSEDFKIRVLAPVHPVDYEPRIETWVVSCSPVRRDGGGCPGSETGYYYERWESKAAAERAVVDHIGRNHTPLDPPVTATIHISAGVQVAVCVACTYLAGCQHPEHGYVPSSWRTEPLPIDEAQAALASHLRDVHGVTDA